MAKAKKAASSVANSGSGTRFGGTRVSNPDPAGFKDPGDAPAQGHVDKAGVVSRKQFGTKAAPLTAANDASASAGPKPKSMKPGGGGRFDAFVSRLVAEGKTTSQAKGIAASAGRAKYGAAKFNAMAQKGRKRA